jgi:tetratricopeptide (TPR) repeat protein
MADVEDTLMQRHLSHLRRTLVESLSEGELRDLCFDLGVEYADLPGEGRADKARELVRHLDRRDRISQLIEVGKRLRPDVLWEAPSVLPQSQIPHNLPPRSEFVGREAEKARIHEAFKSRSYLISIDGIGGIGKTSLALEVAYECLQASRGEGPTDDIAIFDGFIWTTAKDRDLDLDDLLNDIARTLEYPGILQKPAEEKQEKWIAVRKLLQTKPYLLIVDNFETVIDDQVRDFLLDLPEPSKALITTREQRIRQVWAISLKGLEEPEALALVRSTGKRLGLRSVEQAENQELRHLYEATGGAPLAIKWAVGQIKQQGQSLDTVLSALYEARGSIFDSIFSRSWGLLSPSSQRVLKVMPLFATSASRAGIEAASDIHHFAFDDALGQLVEMSLVDATDELNLARRRYSVHPLTRAFAEDKLKQEPEIQQAARQRLAEHLLSFIQECSRDRYAEGFAQLEPELPNVLAAISWCWEQQLIDLGLDITYGIRNFMINYGYWNDLLDLSQQAVQVAIDRGKELDAARLREYPIAWIHRHRGDLLAAEEQEVQSLAVFRRLGDRRRIASAKRHLGRIAMEQGDLEEAKALLSEAQRYYESLGDRHRLSHVVINLAEVAMQHGDLDTAWTLGHSVLDQVREFGDPERLSHLLGVLGGVARRRGDLDQAHTYLEESIALVTKVRRLDAIADSLFGLAEIEMDKGRRQSAREGLTDALEIYRRLDVQSRVQEVEKLLAGLSGANERNEADEKQR